MNEGGRRCLVGDYASMLEGATVLYTRARSPIAPTSDQVHSAWTRVYV